jgi:hypothetical protein
MKEALGERLTRSHSLYVDLVEGLEAETLGSDLPGLPSNTIGAQLWCVVGARHSYALAARAGSWQGFSCPLSGDQVTDPEAVIEALESTFGEVVEALGGEIPPEGEGFLLDLLEHEAQHHGQLIRYLYGLGIERPDSWKERYALA